MSGEIALRVKRDVDVVDLGGASNVIRACDTAIDLANMVIRQPRLGIPSESRESFATLVRERLITADLGTSLQKMVGFRNLAVHRYDDLNLEIVAAVIRRNLDEILAFGEAVRPILTAAPAPR